MQRNLSTLKHTNPLFIPPSWTRTQQQRLLPSTTYRDPVAENGMRVGAFDTKMESGSQVMLRVWDRSELAVSIYPRFEYNAIGAGGPGTIIKQEGNETIIIFDVEKFQIPPLDYRSARVLGIPIPPPLKIEIFTKALQGSLDPMTGKMELEFDAEFEFSIGSLYKAPILKIQTVLTTEASTGEVLKGKGRRLSHGQGVLVGVARVPKTDDWFLDNFLMLPTDALARLAVEINCI